LNSVVIKSIERACVEKAVRNYAQWLRAQFAEVEHILWYGSWVSGSHTPRSDVDVCLIVSSSDMPRRERISKYLPFGFSVGMDLCVFTIEEFERLWEISPQWHQAIINGKAL